MERSGTTPIQQLSNEAWRIPKDYLEPRTKNHAAYRWIGTLVISLIYALRLYYIRGFSVITNLLGLYLTNLHVGFRTPRVGNKTGPHMFEPFVPLLPEFEYWYSATMAVCITFLLSFFPFLDIPEVDSFTVFYLICFAILFAHTILHSRHLFIRHSITPQDDRSKKLSK